MDLPVGKQSKDFWQGHVAAASNFEGSRAEYCRQNGLVISRFAYYRQKLLKKSKFSEIRPTTGISSAPQAKESISYPHRLPDPKWLSALIRELCR